MWCQFSFLTSVAWTELKSTRIESLLCRFLVEKWYNHIAATSWVLFVPQAVWNAGRKQWMLISSELSNIRNLNSTLNVTPICNSAFHVFIIMLGHVRQVIATDNQNSPKVCVTLLNDDYRLFQRMSTPWAGCIDQMVTKLALTFGRIVRFAVRFRIMAFSNGCLEMVATGWAMPTTTATAGLLVQFIVWRCYDGVVARRESDLWTACRLQL